MSTLISKSRQSCARTVWPATTQQPAEAELVLETVPQLLEGGGSGPAVVANDPAGSLLIQLVSGPDEPEMPPADNDVGAERLTDDELKLIERWIAEGAKEGAVADPAGQAIVWQAIDNSRIPIFAAAIAGSGRLLAVGRGTQLEVYHLPSRSRIAQPTDPMIAQRWELPERSHVDVIQAMRFAPDERVIATGGFRTIKLWQRNRPVDPLRSRPTPLGHPAICSVDFPGVRTPRLGGRHDPVDRSCNQ